VEAVKSFSPGVGLVLENHVTYLQNGRLLLRDNLTIAPINDANILVVDNGCSYQQLANWDDASGNVLVNKALYERMNNISRAGLYIHEALYKIDRSFFWASTSDRIRRTTAEALSGATNFPNLARWKTDLDKVVVAASGPEELTVTQNPNRDGYSVTYHMGDENFWAQKVEVSANLEFTGKETLVPQYRAQIAEKIRERASEVARYDTLPRRRRNEQAVQEFHRVISRLNGEISLLEQKISFINRFDFSQQWLFSNERLLTAMTRIPTSAAGIINFNGEANFRAGPTQREYYSYPELLPYELTITVKVNGRVVKEELVKDVFRDNAPSNQTHSISHPPFVQFSLKVTQNSAL
jgi:hypothetical protein